MARKPLPSSPERDALIAEIVEKMRRQLKEQLPDTSATLDQIEDIAGQIGRTVSQDIQKKLVEERNQVPRPPKTQCTCGSRARYKGEQGRSIVTVHGVLTYARACYHCSYCHKSLAPVDAGLGLDSGSTTTQVRLWVALLGAQLPFAQAATTLEMLTRVSLSAASLERLNVVIGTALRHEQHQKAQMHQHGRLPQPEEKRPKRLYVGMDGVFVPLRDAWKKDKSLGNLSCRYGECKSGVVYEALPDKAGKDSQVRTRAYVATLEKVEAFAPLLGTLAHENGHHLAKEVIVIGDGAAWIWQVAAKHFSGAVQIVDFFHAAQHLASVAEARFGLGSAQGQAWVEARCEELKTTGVELVLAHLKAWKPTKKAHKELRRVTYVYFFENAQRMQYPAFLAKGYHIGSGVVEATCKHVVAQRLDQAGMHWTKESAEAILALRAAQLSTHPPDLRPYCVM
jgi:hypothetical protein